MIVALLLALLAFTTQAHAEIEVIVVSPWTSVTNEPREPVIDVTGTLERSAAIRAQHAREAEQARREAQPAPRSYSSKVPFPQAPALTPIPEPYMSREPDWFMLQTPSGDLYYNYGGGMIQGPRGELYQLY